MNENRCVCCGEVIPEGTQLCWSCKRLACDPVDHPSHYTQDRIECIDAMIETQGKDAVIDFCVCNAFKYLWRHEDKNGMEDLKKARWYLDKALSLKEPYKLDEKAKEETI